MYSEELEELIGAVLADGVITDKEREVLHKKAAEEGVDPDELDVVIDGRLAKMRPTPPPVPQPQPVQSTKMGNVMKCPSCGAPYEPGTGKCPVCGHVFQNLEALKSSVKLAEGIQNKLKVMKNGDRWSELEEYIKNFPVPTDKDDLLDFILSLDAKRRTIGGDIAMGGLYNVKYREVVNKAKVIFPGDAQMEKAIAMTDKFYMTPTQKFFCYIFGGILVFAIFVLLLNLI